MVGVAALTHHEPPSPPRWSSLPTWPAGFAIVLTLTVAIALALAIALSLAGLSHALEIPTAAPQGALEIIFVQRRWAVTRQGPQWARGRGRLALPELPFLELRAPRGVSQVRRTQRSKRRRSRIERWRPVFADQRARLATTPTGSTASAASACGAERVAAGARPMVSRPARLWSSPCLCSRRSAGLCRREAACLSSFLGVRASGSPG